MSGEARALLERQAEAWNADDWEALAALFGPETEMQGPPDWPESGSYRGWEAIRAQYERLREPWRSDSVEFIEIVGDGDRATGRFIWRCRGHDSGVVFEERMSVAVRCADGRFSELLYFRSFDAALAALGD